MENRIKKLLYDIFSSIQNIEKYLGEKRIFEEYEKNPMLQDAIEKYRN
jgi:uncharacterized protein with HEPN domain